MRRSIPMLAFVLVSAACGDEANPVVDVSPDLADALADTLEPDVASDADVDDTEGPDLRDADDVSDAVGDADDASEPDAAGDANGGPDRVWSHRAIGGMSMGAMAITIALERPGTFDIVGALGGYADTTYMMAEMLRLHFSGFCGLDALEAHVAAHGGLTGAEAAAALSCATADVRSELEVPQDFNHLLYDTNGITMTRGFYGDVIDNFSSVYGNLSSPEHPEAPMLPAGLDLDWYRQTGEWDRCANNRPIAPERAFNAEYNPLGTYEVYPLCDRERPEDPTLLPSEYDGAAAQDAPIDALLFIDLDGDGRRSAPEPLFLNPWERFDDVGLDGCADALEDGAGGCLAAPAAADAAPPAIPPLATDPNGDRFHWLDNPTGLERNDRYDLGEPFIDLGLDGVSQAISGAPDEGEGNGTWDAVPAFSHLLSHDADTLLRALPDADLAKMDFWLDAGIRDVLNAGVVARGLFSVLAARGRAPTRYYGYAQAAGTIAPDLIENDFATEVFARDLTWRGLGRDVYVEYGKWDATPAEIAAGDGKHVGREIDALNRLAAFLATAFTRFPEPDREPEEFPDVVASFESFYSPALGGRRGFTIALPPGYHEPRNAGKRYPVVYFLHGLGQDASDLAPAALVTSILMTDGRVPKALLVLPDGGCCFVDTETGARECACREVPGGVHECADPTCEGPTETCELRRIPNRRLERECHRGSLYADMRSNRWGEPRSDLGYKTSVHELVEHVDRTWRTRAGDAIPAAPAR